MISHRRRLVTFALTLVVSCGLAFAAGLLPFVASVENALRDFRIAFLTPPVPQHDEIVLIEMTEDTLDLFTYRSPPNRGFLADLIDRMSEAGARAVALDVLFYRPTEPALDQRLKDSLEKARMPVIIATATDKVADIEPREIEFQREFARDAIQGDAQVIQDPVDSFVRRQRPLPADPAQLPSFSAAVALALGHEVQRGEMPIAWRVTASPDIDPFPAFAAHTVRYLPLEWFTGKIVFIGSDLPDIDRYPTPLSRRDDNWPTAGVEIQAHKLAQILDGRRLPIPSRAGDVATLVAAAAIGIFFALLPIPILAKGLLVMASIGGYWVGAFYLYEQGGPLLSIIGPSLALPTATAFAEAFEGGEARRQRRFVSRAFEHFVAPAVVQSLIADPSKLRLGGERRDISTIFTDIKGFTTLSEKLPPERMTALLNDYLDRMLQVILDHDGTIDKVVGDALHCFFGAPGDQPDHARRALDCALALDRTSQTFCRETTAGGEEWGLTRIGVHTGNVLVGNFGGRLRFNYTAHGDAVNTAARLEGANKYLGTRVCISQATLDECPGASVRPAAELLLVGKTIPIATFEPIDEPTEATRRYVEAYEAMRDGRMIEARTILAELAEATPEDGLVAMHLARIDRGENGVLVRLEGK
ncbi:MAG: adenylate/guanylate cyclase domain-containing protein [Geminicoccaceae bacterium]|nr:adenylate/guanylate cyclase domain-containing protein [Geminicoccaceae bacterium]